MPATSPKTCLAAPPAEVVVDGGPEQTGDRAHGRAGPVRRRADGRDRRRQLSWQAWPADAVDANFITRDAEADALDKLKGSIARVAMYSGEPLRRSKLIGEGQSFMSSILPSGKRAIATQIAADTSAGGFILPNDYVDVIMTRRSTAAVGERKVSSPKQS